MSQTNLPALSLQDFMEAGVHYGHKTMRWHPKMAPYIYGSRNNVHIIDLRKTLPMFQKALEAIYQVVINNGRVLFVGTKMQASTIVSQTAERCGQYYVNHRWLGGMLTNWETVSKSIKTLIELEDKIQSQQKIEQYLEENKDQDAAEVPGMVRYTKKEMLDLTRKYDNLNRSLGGIRKMGGMPDIVVVFDVIKDSIAIKEAQKLGVPIVAIVDSNANPEGIDFPIPGNDDATRALELYGHLFAEAVLAGIQKSIAASGVDLGESTDVEKLSGKSKASAAKKKDAKPAKAEEKEAVSAEAGKSEEKKPAAKKATTAKKAEAEVNKTEEAQGE